MYTQKYKNEAENKVGTDVAIIYWRKELLEKINN